MPSVAEVLIDSLNNLGVKHIYGIVGDSLNAITDAAHQKGIKWIGVRHEETAAFAAGAESQLTGKLAVCAGSCGPGNMHLINGLYDSHRSQTPVLAIAAHIEREEIGGHYYQETHPQFLFKECSYFCELVSCGGQMPRMLGIAIQTALTKRGVSVLVIPGDLALKDASITEPADWPSYSEPNFIPNKEDLKKMANILNKAKRPALLCGIGCTKAQNEIKNLCETLQSPLVHTIRAKDILDFDNPFNVGMTGLLGIPSGYYALQKCDTLLMLGTDFPYRQFYPSHNNVIQIDQSGENIGRRHPAKIGVIGRVKETIQALIPLLEKHKNKEFLDEIKRIYEKSQKELVYFTEKDISEKPIHPQYLASLISKLSSDDAIFTCDVGTVTIWAARYLKMNGKRKLLGSFKHGSMASALPQSIGAQIAFPNKEVIALCGDGGFSMLMGDLLTIKQLNLPIKIIIFNNSNLAMVDLEMKTAGFLEYGTNLTNPNFADIAKICGIHGVHIEDPLSLESELKKALQHKGPVLINVIINRVELALPPKIMAEHIKGMSIYSAKAILNGKGNELYELLTTNLWK